MAEQLANEKAQGGGGIATMAVLTVGSLPMPGVLRDEGKSKVAVSSRSSLSSVGCTQKHQQPSSGHTLHTLQMQEE